MPTRTIPWRLVIGLVMGLCALGSVGACASPLKTHAKAPESPLPEAERARRERAIHEADKAFRADEPAEAEKLYLKALAQYPDFGQAWNNLGVVLKAQDRYLEAGEAFDRASELEPTDPRPAYNRGLLWFDRGYLRESLPYFLDAIERDPNYLPALRSAIRTSVLLRQTSEVTLDHIQRALLIETDQKWRDYFERQRLLIEADLASQKQDNNLGQHP